MAVFNGFFPIITSEDAARDFVAELQGSKRTDWEALRDLLGITRETWTMQQTPNGSFMLVWFEGSDVERAFAGLAQEDSEFATWYRGKILDLTGADLSAPPQGPPPETVIDWTR